MRGAGDAAFRPRHGKNPSLLVSPMSPARKHQHGPVAALGECVFSDAARAQAAPVLERMSAAGPPARHSEAERACAYVIDKVRASSGRWFHQGARVPPLASTSTSPVVRFIAEQRIHRVPTSVARALLAWADGFPVELLTCVPPATRVLALQAAGRRCVSLLAHGAETGPHEDALAFAVHDLCHLDKFIDPEHHRGQVGFFALLHRAVANGSWGAFEAQFDSAFGRDWRHVAADMNGSSVFLFAALKMKLKMAVRRRAAQSERSCPEPSGPLTADELRVYRHFLEEMLTLLSLHGDLAEAARQTSARRDAPAAASKLLAHFEEAGECVLRDRPASHRSPL
jgi:hypothetical protein